MKKKTGKWIRHGRLAGMLFILATLALAVYGSFAAYTSFNSVRRVVSTGMQSDTMFSSNYLSLLNIGDNNYPAKRISLADNDEICRFTVLVCNYVWGDETLYNPKDIKYTVTAQVLALDGGSLPDGITSIKVNNTNFSDAGSLTLKSTLVSGSAHSDLYRFEFPAALKNQVKIEVVAKPDTDSREAVNSQKLAAIFSFADYKATKNWTGHFLDSQVDRMPKDYDAFNYEISGNGAGTVTVTWDSELQLSKWATGGTQKSSPYSFNVDDSTTAIQFQFYRNPASPLGDTISWTELEALVDVSFTES